MIPSKKRRAGCPLSQPTKTTKAKSIGNVPEIFVGDEFKLFKPGESIRSIKKNFCFAVSNSRPNADVPLSHQGGRRQRAKPHKSGRGLPLAGQHGPYRIGLPT